MKKIIFLLSLISCQVMAYPNIISTEYPLNKNVVKSSLADDSETSIKESLKYNKNLKSIYDKLSQTQKKEFEYYLSINRDSVNKLYNISFDPHLLVANEALKNKMTIDNIYVDYVFYKNYPQFIKSYFTIQSIIKSDDNKLFKQNMENAKKIAERQNKVDSYMSHMEEVKKQILQLVDDGKTMKDVDQYIEESFKKEKEYFINSIDKDQIPVLYNYIQYGINQYNNDSLSQKEKDKYLDFLNNKEKDFY